MEEYCVANPEGRLTKYAGSRMLTELPPGRKTGASFSETVVLAESATIFKGGMNKKEVILPKGCKVWRWITPLEGRR